MRRDALLWIALCSTGCAGPERGWIAELRGRTETRREREEAPGSASPSAQADIAGGRVDVPLFPLLYVERSPEASATEVLWPLYESGSSSTAPGVASSFFRLRPLIYVDSFERSSRVVIFPVYFHLREQHESGDLAVDHFWPLYGFHREWIDLAPATTHHFAWPLIYFRFGPARWKVSIFPLVAASEGYLDRGWWIAPVIRWGSQGQSAFFYLLDPLIAYERDSIAESVEDFAASPQKTRTSFNLLGGLLGWENDRGYSSLRLLWWLKI